ncbi:hypothetical protein [Pelagicoccus sp. SDUM812002]|uniref:hypothetical protein n=1 Tax=Pelagicoccus sp. SDUM812002 TaxID=3041266 RepID=UPI00280E3DA6|nr:hypothetical protein [Pelagicoccus sp. SDUM812002]MDQ8187955.1 hypothetical protein [Pelagicoccus sp. SDUM812002]
MNLQEFTESVESDAAPEGMDGALSALWWDAKGDWNQAHEHAQDAGNREGDWVHAYLHRKEGDEGNAGYWYSRASQPFFEGSLADEWRHIAGTLLGEGFAT